jgi:hypothetical protein
MGHIFHVTPKKNLDSIQRLGIDPAFAVAEIKRSWFCSVARLGWALVHVSQRHATPITELVILECNIPEGWRRASHLDGLMSVTRVTPPVRIRQQYPAQELVGPDADPSN